MRKTIGSLFAAVVFLLAGPAHAQWWNTQAHNDIVALRDAMKSVKVVAVPSREAPYDYYDIQTENLCEGSVGRVVRAWVENDGYWSKLNRAVLINAIIAGESKPVPLLVHANFVRQGAATFVCQPFIAIGVPSRDKRQIRIEVISSSGIGDGAADLVASSIKTISSALGTIGGGWGKVIFSALKNVAPEATTLKKLLISEKPARTESFSFGAHVAKVEIGPGAVPVMTITKVQRPQLLNFRPGQNLGDIPSLINEVSSTKKWEEMVLAAAKGNQWTNSDEGLRSFCIALRSELMQALRYDGLAVALGLWFHEINFGHSYAAGEKRCLSPRDRARLQAAGFALVS
jgi:hypothetical protein